MLKMTVSEKYLRRSAWYQTIGKQETLQMLGAVLSSCLFQTDTHMSLFYSD